MSPVVTSCRLCACPHANARSGLSAYLLLAASPQLPCAAARVRCWTGCDVQSHSASAPPCLIGRAGEPASQRVRAALLYGGPRPTRHGWQTVRESIRDCRGHREACNCGHHTELVLSSTAVPFRWPRAGATALGLRRGATRGSSVPGPRNWAKAGGASAAGLCLGLIRGRVQGCSCVWPEETVISPTV